MKKMLCWIVFVLGCGGVVFGAGWDREKADRVNKEQGQAEKNAPERRGIISEEIKKIGAHPWAGEYSGGMMLSREVLTIAPESGYFFEEHACLGAMYDYGIVSYENNRVILASNLSYSLLKNSNRLTLVPVRWGEQHYLVPEESMVDFCNEVNSGNPLGLWFAFLRKGDPAKSADGLPDVPEEYRQFLLKEPMKAKVVEVSGPVAFVVNQTSEIQKFRYTVTFDAGSKGGLREGMKLHLVEDGDRYEARLATIEENRSTGIAELYKREKAPEVGWTFSTRSKEADEFGEIPKDKKSGGAKK